MLWRRVVGTVFVAVAATFSCFLQPGCIVDRGPIARPAKRGIRFTLSCCVVEGQVGNCKRLIEESRNVEASSLKIIHSGKVLNDDDTFAGVGVKENDFLVYMAKPKV